jgi:hypothetical protein
MKTKNLHVSNFDQNISKNMKKHLSGTGVSIKFFVTKAIEEKLQRDTKNEK